MRDFSKILGGYHGTEDGGLIAHDDHDHDDDHDHADHDEHDHAEHNHDDHDGHDHAGHDHHHNHDHADMTTYNCQPEQLIEAHYETDDTAAAQDAHLLIDGIEYDLTAMAAPAANSATIYETDIGVSNDAGMRWQLSADGQTAVLSHKTLDGSIPQAQEAVLFECQKAAS